MHVVVMRVGSSCLRDGPTLVKEGVSVRVDILGLLGGLCFRTLVLIIYCDINVCMFLLGYQQETVFFVVDILPFQ